MKYQGYRPLKACPHNRFIVPATMRMCCKKSIIQKFLLYDEPLSMLKPPAPFPGFPVERGIWTDAWAID
jgi:hypothetical protein